MRRSKAPPNPYQAAREAARRSALRALKKARRVAAAKGVDLSEWEDEFLGSVESRITEHGRAFADPEKGAPGQPLSALQKLKLKEISAKATGAERERRSPRRRDR